MPKAKKATDIVREYLATIGAKGGAVKSKDKTKAARANGRKGGRPPKKRR